MDEEDEMIGPVLKTDDPQSPMWKAIGASIREARARKKYSQQALGQALSHGRTRAAIAQYESGTNPPSLQTIFDIADALEVRPQDLVAGKVSWGERVKQMGQHIPISRGGQEDETVEHLSLPESVLREFGGAEKALEMVRLAVDAGGLGGRVGDYVLIDTGSGEIKADGALYAVRTPAGAALMRAEPFLTPDGTVMLTSGQNVTATLVATSIPVLGKVVATLQRSL